MKVGIVGIVSKPWETLKKCCRRQSVFSNSTWFGFSTSNFSEIACGSTSDICKRATKALMYLACRGAWSSPIEAHFGIRNGLIEEMPKYQPALGNRYSSRVYAGRNESMIAFAFGSVHSAAFHGGCDLPSVRRTRPASFSRQVEHDAHRVDLSGFDSLNRNRDRIVSFIEFECTVLPVQYFVWACVRTFDR